MKNIKHYIVIRFFNNTIGNFSEKDILSDKILEMGICLFKENLLQSLKNQICKDFEIILLIHNKLNATNKYFNALIDLSNQLQFKMHVLTYEQFKKLLVQTDFNCYSKRIISRVDYDDLILNLVVADIQNIAMKMQDKPIIIYGYNNGYAWRDDTMQLYEISKNYGFNGHFSTMQSVILDLNIKEDFLLKIHPYLWDHSSIRSSIKQEFIDKYMQLMHNNSIRAYVWMRHKNTGSIDPYKFKCDKIEQIIDKKIIKSLDFKSHFGRNIEIKI